MNKNILELYESYIYDRSKDLVNSGKEYNDWNNFDLAKIFEYYTCIQLSKEYNDVFYEYNDIEPGFKEVNQMSRNDTGIDCCNLKDTIVQCKLRKDTLNLHECATFLGSQNYFNEETLMTDIRWRNLIIARNSCCKMTDNLLSRRRIFIDKAYNRVQLLDYCKSLIDNPPVRKVYEEPLNELRYYQKEAIEIITGNKQNSIICLPTGCGKNAVMIHSMIPGKKYLVLVPYIILLEQMKEEIIRWKPSFKSKIQTIGDGEGEFKNKDITICVYNSVSKVAEFAGEFEKIFVDEAHRISTPEIYKIDDDEYEESFSGEDSDWDDESFSEDFSDEEYYSGDDEDSSENVLDEKYEGEDDNEDDNEDENEDDNEDELKVSSGFKRIIKGFRKFNNNVYMSATLDEEDGFLYYKKDIRDMIEEGFLCDYTIHVPIFRDDPTNRNICEHLVKNYRNIIVYCNSHKEGKEINRILNLIQKGCADYIDCSTSKKKRNDILDKFKKGLLAFLINVRILVEGYNCPSVKGCFFVHLPSSKTKIIQIIGRALRLHEDKTISNIILPFSSKEDEKPISNFLKEISRNDRRIRKCFESKQLGSYINIEREDVDDEEQNEDIEFRYNLVYDSCCVLMNEGEVFEKKLEELKDYINKESKLPSKVAKERVERKLGSWLNTQKQNYKNEKNNMKNIDKRKKWEEFINNCDYFLTNDELWNGTLKNITEYILKNKKIPSQHSHIKEEKKLGSWIFTQKKNYKHNKFVLNYVDRKEKWEEFINNNNIFSQNEKWFITLKDCIKFIDENKKNPSIYSNDKEEVRLAMWIRSNKNNYIKKIGCMKDENDRKKWEDFIKTYYITKDKIDIWDSTLKKVMSFIDTKKKSPSQHSNNTEEEKLGKWINTNKNNYKNNKNIMKNIEERKKWEEFVNNYNILTYNEKWYSNLEIAIKFIDTKKKSPSQHSNDAEEGKIGKWINTNKNNYKNNKNIMKNIEERKKWEEFINNYSILTHSDTWSLNLKNAIDFIVNNKKLPCAYSTDKEEKKIYSWISINKNKYIKQIGSMKDENNRKKWEEFITKYNIRTTDESWNNTLELVIKFIFDNKKNPSKGSKNFFERKLGAWVSGQKKIFKTDDGIKNIEKKNKWDEFIKNNY